MEMIQLEDAVVKGSSNISLNKVKDDDGVYPLYSAKGFYKNISFFHQEEEYLAIIKDGAGIGRISIHPPKSSCVGTMQYLIPKEGFDIRFIRYCLLSIDFTKYSQGATIPHIYFKDYKSELIPKLSVEEQLELVSKLDQAFEAIDQAIANTQKSIDNVEELEKSWFQEQFREGQADWIDSVIGDIGKVSMCKRILKKQTTTEGDIPFYKIGTFGKTPDAFITEKLFSEYVQKYSFPKKGDVLISASGTIGRRVRFDGKPSYFQDSNIVWIANDEQHVLNDFLYEFYGYCNWNPTSGATIKRLYNDDLRKIKISYPKSLLQQSSLVESMQNFRYKIESISSSYEMKLIELKELKMSILEKAFKGELV